VSHLPGPQQHGRLSRKPWPELRVQIGEHALDHNGHLLGPDDDRLADLTPFEIQKRLQSSQLATGKARVGIADPTAPFTLIGPLITDCAIIYVTDPTKDLRLITALKAIAPYT